MKTKFNHIGSLITYEKDGEEICLGNLLAFDGHGIFDATLGKVDVSPEDAKTHNELLDQAMIEGLDKNCEIGQGGTFYLSGPSERKVKTWAGTTVSSEVTVRNKTITFKRLGKTYRGRLQKDADCFNFRRIA